MRLLIAFACAAAAGLAQPRDAIQTAVAVNASQPAGYKIPLQWEFPPTSVTLIKLRR